MNLSKLTPEQQLEIAKTIAKEVFGLNWEDTTEDQRRDFMIEARVIGIFM